MTAIRGMSSWQVWSLLKVSRYWRTYLNKMLPFRHTMGLRKRVDLSKIELKALDCECTHVDMHTHTRFSFDSNALIQNIIKRLRKYRFGIAVTDHDVIGGVKAM